MYRRLVTMMSCNYSIKIFCQCVHETLIPNLGWVTPRPGTSCGRRPCIPSYVTDKKWWARFRNDAHAIRLVLALCHHWLWTLRKYQFANEGCIKWKRYVCTSTEERSRLKASVSLRVLKKCAGWTRDYLFLGNIIAARKLYWGSESGIERLRWLAHIYYSSLSICSQPVAFPIPFG